LKSKRICVVGGLGYLGSALCKQLRRKGHTVSIVDSNLYGKFSTEEIQAETEIAIEDIINADLHFDAFDPEVIFVALTKFTREQIEQNKFLAEYMHKRDCAISKLRDKYTVHVLDEDVPLLYGSSRGFRSDTLINSLIIDAVTTGKIMISNPVEAVKFCEVNRYAEWIADMDYSEGLVYSSALQLMIGYTLIKIFGSEVKLGINFDENSSRFDICGHTSVNSTEFEQLKHFANEIQQVAQSPNAEYLLGITFDNSYHVSNLINGFNYRSFYND